MAIVADHLTLDLSALPTYSEKLGAGFYLGLGNNKKPLLLVAPGSGNSVEPHVRYAAGMVLTLADGMIVKDLGQLVVTSDRIIGVMTRGSAGPVKLDDTTGSVYAFSAGLDDLHPAEPRKNRRGGVTGAVIRSRDGRPGFVFEVNSVIGSLEDDGQLAYRASLADLLRSLTPESRSMMTPYTGSL